jgi:hypothetical protein
MIFFIEFSFSLLCYPFFEKNVQMKTTRKHGKSRSRKEIKKSLKRFSSKHRFLCVRNLLCDNGEGSTEERQALARQHAVLQESSLDVFDTWQALDLTASGEGWS